MEAAVAKSKVIANNICCVRADVPKCLHYLLLIHLIWDVMTELCQENAAISV